MTDLQNIGDLFRGQLKSDISAVGLGFELDRTVFIVYQGKYSISFIFDRSDQLVSFKIEEV
jgi:hypothetical protein